MNLRTAQSINLSEATRLLKQSNVGTNNIQSQQVPPPMLFMQHAVAMQQFQFQQALLMQQVMATQQAAARAATVKSAQEMAAARAAEISKLLKGIEPNVEEKKKSPQRFISRMPSRSCSRSRSFSRSKSRSPLRYRRDRATSRSPIWCRRDSCPSPISREYFGYRGQSRRGYYRGYREYSWNFLYRRDWEREKDQYSLYSHRSRSRGFRRSCTPSNSPRSQRERSRTPLSFRHKKQRLERSSRLSRSLETKPIPSCSQSRSYSCSGSHSESLHHEYDSHSPIQRLRDKKIGGDRNQAKKVSLMPGGGKGTLMKNPSTTNGIKEKIHSTAIINENEGILEHWSFRSKGKIEQSISPTRLLSVSLSPPKKKEQGKLERESKPNDWKKAIVRGVLFQRIDEVVTMDEPLQSNMAPVEDGKGNPNAFVEQQIGIKGDVKSKEGEFEVNEQCAKKEFDKMKLLFDENDVDKEVDDWQDDIKVNKLEKIKHKEYKQEMDKKKEDKKNLDILIVVHEDVKDHVTTLLEHLDKETRKLSVDYSIASEDQGNAIASTISKRSTPNNDVIFAKPTSSNETLINGLCIKEEILNMASNGSREKGHIQIDEEIEDATNDKNTKSDNVIDREGDSSLIFEGPMLPLDLDLEISEDFEEKNYAAKNYDNIIEKTRPKELSSLVLKEEVVIFNKKDKSRSKEVEDVHGLQRSNNKPMLKDDNQSYEKCKLKEKSELKDGSRHKRYNDKVDYEKRKEKHHKHKKRHRRTEEVEKEENDNDENKDVDFNENKEERHCHCNKKYGRGRNHKGDKHEKRRYRHKHRGKLTLEPLDKKSLVVAVEGNDIN